MNSNLNILKLNTHNSQKKHTQGKRNISNAQINLTGLVSSMISSNSCRIFSWGMGSFLPTELVQVEVRWQVSLFYSEHL